MRCIISKTLAAELVHFDKNRLSIECNIKTRLHNKLKC